ncbi:hypothetical protein [Devosia sp. CN2-171]
MTGIANPPSKSRIEPGFAALFARFSLSNAPFMLPTMIKKLVENLS